MAYLVRLAFIIGAAALFAGCGGSAPPMGAPGAVAQSRTIAAHADRGGSWMPPGDKSQALIYASGGCGGACVLSYPEGKLLGSVSISGAVQGTCSDNKGNVFITNDTDVLEFAHGGTSPIATLNLPGSAATGCAVDATTGNLAVVFNASGVGIGIFPHATGPPTVYGAGLFPVYCGYDDNGNLFASGYGNSSTPGMSELAKGSSGFSVLSVEGALGEPGQMQWDGSQMTYESRTKGNIKILRLRVSGSRAKVIGTTRLKGSTGQAYQSWLYGNAAVVPFGDHGQYAHFVGIWRYPDGGKHLRKIKHLGKLAAFYGVTISVASSR